MTDERKYLKDVLPRLYRETEAWLEKEGRDDLQQQLPHLFITDRCSCGACSDFSIDSDIPELSREAGSALLLRPLYYRMDNGFSIGLSGAEGLTVGEHRRSYISSFELMGGDYSDDYIHLSLNKAGFRVDRKRPKRTRPGSAKKRRSLQRRLRKYRGAPINPLSPEGKWLRKRITMKRKMPK